MGFKNMFKKSSKLFDREGFYIILFVCLCIVAVTAVYISRNNANTARRAAEDNQNIEQPIDHTDLVNTEQDKNNNPAAPTMKTPEKSTNTSSTSTSNPGETKKSEPAKVTFKLAMPVDGEVKKDKAYDKETLVPWADGSWQTHEGIDITCDIGSEVKASADGKVVKVFNDDQLVLDNTVGWGMTVVIEHKNGIQTVYCNLGEDVKVKVGDTVKKGDVIAVVGDTATCEPAAIEGSHLHFAVIKKSGDSYETLDPSKYLK